MEKEFRFSFLNTMDDQFENCVVKEAKKTPFPDNSFVEITEKGKSYLVNTDYIISCVIQRGSDRMHGFDEWLTDDSQPEHKEPYYPSAEPDDELEGR